MSETSSLLSRVANSVYWMGRYIERAAECGALYRREPQHDAGPAIGVSRPVAADGGHHR